MNSDCVNIVTVTYNRLEFTKCWLEGLLENDPGYPAAITVVDNGSTDGSVEWLKQQRRHGHINNLLLHTENRGVATASNDGWRLVDSDYYLKLDNDIVMKKQGWLAAMVNVMKQVYDRVGVLGYNFESKSYGIQRIAGCNLRPKKGNLGGCCILIPKTTRRKLGVWCEEYGYYGEEDADYGLRVELSGLLSYYMEDEDIGTHLPDGKAADFDSGLRQISSEDEQYNRFKWGQRLQAIAEDSPYRKNRRKYVSKERSLYVDARADVPLPEVFTGL